MEKSNSFQTKQCFYQKVLLSFQFNVPSLKLNSSFLKMQKMTNKYCNLNRSHYKESPRTFGKVNLFVCFFRQQNPNIDCYLTDVIRFKQFQKQILANHWLFLKWGKFGYKQQLFRSQLQLQIEVISFCMGTDWA